LVLEQEPRKDETVIDSSEISPSRIEIPSTQVEVPLVETESTDSIFEISSKPHVLDTERLSLQISAAASIGLATVIAYSLLWLTLSSAPFLDLPNHLARSTVIAKLLTNPTSWLHGFFEFSPQFVPYIFGDLALSALTVYFSEEDATRIWILLSFWGVPLSLLAYGRAKGLGGRTLLFFFPLTIYLASDWFFMSGFFNYRLGMALTFFTLTLWEMFVRKSNLGPEHSARRILLWFAFTFGCVACYLMHLAAFFFLGAILGVTAIFRKCFAKHSFSTTFLTLLPLACLSAWHLSLMILADKKDSSIVEFRSVAGKLRAFGTPFIRFSTIEDLSLLVAFVAVLVLTIGAARAASRGANYLNILRENVLVVATLFTLFILLPVECSNLYDVDDRALPFLLSILLLSFCQHLNAARIPKLSLYCSAIFGVANLFYLSIHIIPLDNRLLSYTEALSHIPAQASVLPVDTWEDEGRIQSGLHAGALYTAMTEGVTPYIFAGDNKDVMSYFRYRHRPEAPDLFWYLRSKPTPDWKRILPYYDYVVVTKPFDQSRLKMNNLYPVFSNDAAIVFATVQK